MHCIILAFLPFFISQETCTLNCPENGRHVNIGDGANEIEKYYDILNWNKCGQLCNENPSCHYWTWLNANSQYYGDCHLYSQMDHCDAYADAVSGARTCV